MACYPVGFQPPTFIPPNQPPGAPPPQVLKPQCPKDSVDIRSEDVVKRDLDRLRAYSNQVQQTWKKGEGGLLYERNKPEATVAVLDNHGIEFNQGHPEVQHGELTSGLAGQATGKGERGVMRVDDTGSTRQPMPDPKSPTFDSDLKKSLVDNYLGPMKDATSALKELQAKHPNIKALSQSREPMPPP